MTADAVGPFGPLAALRTLLPGMPVFAPGSVWLTGAGPGDPGHLTLHAIAGLVQADVAVHDALIEPSVLDLLRPDAERLFAGKRGGRPSASQADISTTLIARAQAGARVLRLKGGDPYVFGRGGEEARALAQAGVPFRVIPGLTAGLAGLTEAGIPATLRGTNQAVVLATGFATDPESAVDWASFVRLGQPIVLYMAQKTIDSISAALLAAGVDPALPAAAIWAASTPQQRVEVTTLREIGAVVQAGDASRPAVIVLGAIVAARAELARTVGVGGADKR
jgi:uroporphyrin-III C-methyltransferase